MARFSEKLAEYAQERPNFGPLEGANAVGTGSLDGQPPFITIYLSCEAGFVRAARFEASGCGVTVAAAAMLSEMVRDLRLSDCEQLDAQAVASALDGIPADKMYCAFVAVAALKNALSMRPPDAANVPRDP